MKKLCILFICAMAAVLVGCGPQSSPEKVVKGYYEALEKQDFDKAVEYVAPNSMIKKEDLSSLLKNIYQGDFGIADYKVLGACKTTNDAADVAVAFQFKKVGKGELDKTMKVEKTVRMDGNWYLVLK